MERIKEAIKLAKQQHAKLGTIQGPGIQIAVAPRGDRDGGRHAGSQRDESAELDSLPAVKLSSQHLERNRILTQHSEISTAAPYEVLRTRIVQEMDQRSWNVVVLTSPTPRCGKTVTAINLAISIAKLPDRHVILLDLDLRRPSVTQYLGIGPGKDMQGWLRGETDLRDVLVGVEIGGLSFSVIASEDSVKNPSELIGSPEMGRLMGQLRSLSGNVVVIVDMPPVLTADDVMAFLPHADCCILTIVENQTTEREIDACQDVLSTTNYLGCVLNMSSQAYESYY